MDTVVLHRRRFTEYRLTDQSGRSTEIGRIVEVVLEEVRTKRVQEVPTSAAACTRVAEATQGTPYQTEGDGAGKSPRVISHSSQCVDHNLHNASMAAMSICK